MASRRNAEARPGLGVTFLLLLTLAGCGPADPPAPPPVRWGGETMGTTYSVAVADLPDGLTLKEAKAAVEDELAVVNRQMSTWDPGSELSRFNASGSTDWFPVSAETAAVVVLALDIADDSDGAFDPTVGPLVDQWGFGDAPRPTRAPSDDELAAARAVVGWQKLHARRDPPALRKGVPGLARERFRGRQGARRGPRVRPVGVAGRDGPARGGRRGNCGPAGRRPAACRGRRASRRRWTT